MLRLTCRPLIVSRHVTYRGLLRASVMHLPGMPFDIFAFEMRRLSVIVVPPGWLVAFSAVRCFLTALNNCSRFQINLRASTLGGSRELLQVEQTILRNVSSRFTKRLPDPLRCSLTLSLSLSVRSLS